jgi:uncharacterized protein
MWYRRAAEQDDEDAQFQLGAAYMLGVGVPQDAQQSALWIRKAAEKGQRDAQYQVGFWYATGLGAQEDGEKAAYWYRKAANQGHVEAQHALGRMYAFGTGMPKDAEQAVFWFRKAAEQNGYLAAYMLGSLYFNGKVVQRDPKQAYFWFLVDSRSRVVDSTTSKWLEDLERELSPTDRDDAQTAVRAWPPKVRASESPRTARPAPEAQATPTPAMREVASATGSGFYVAREYLVTNHHVAGNCTRLRVAGQSAGRLVASDPEADLALIAVTDGVPTPASIRVGKATLGEPATVAGFPLSGLLSGLNITSGNVSSLSGIRGSTRLLQTTAPVQAGNSGGPLLDAGGNVIGVVVSKLDAEWVARVAGDVPQNVNFAINASALVSFLDANEIAYKAAPAGSKLSMQEVARRAQAFTFLVECWK